MEPVSPTPDEAPRAAASCPSCRAVTAADQRYCLSCGALLGDRRLDPIEMLTAAAEAAPVGGPTPTGPGAAPRAVPLAAATAAIVVAGISGMLVTNGGSSTDARAAVLAAAAPPAAAAPAAAAPVPAPAGDEQDSDPDPLPDEPPAEDPLPADPLPIDSDEPPVQSAPADELPVDDGAEDEDAAEEPAAESTPRVWLLALEGPQAAEAVERIEKQGVRLSGMEAVASTAQANASALVGGTKPAAAPVVAPEAPATPVAPTDPAAPAAPVVSTDPAAPPATATSPAASPAAPGVPAPTVDPAAAGSTGSDSAATDAAPPLPAALVAAKRTWRAYVDVQPTGAVLPGACAAPPAGDAAAGLLSSRLPFAAIEKIDCDTSVTSLEALGNDLSAGEGVPDFSYVAMGGCAAPERTAVALPDAVEDAVATITASTEYQEGGMLVVTAVGTHDACTPATPGVADPVTPAAPGAPPVAPTAVLRPAATAGRTVTKKLDLLALSRAMAEVLGVTPPGAAGDDAVPAIALPGVPKP